MTLTTSTTHADLTITATFNTETLRVSLDVDGIDAGSAKWRGGITDTAAQLVREDDDATDEVYAALDAGIRAQLARSGSARTEMLKARYPTLSDLASAARSGDLTDVDMSSLPVYAMTEPRDTYCVWSYDGYRMLCGEDAKDVCLRDDITVTVTVGDWTATTIDGRVEVTEPSGRTLSWQYDCRWDGISYDRKTYTAEQRQQLIALDCALTSALQQLA